MFYCNFSFQPLYSILLTICSLIYLQDYVRVPSEHQFQLQKGCDYVQETSRLSKKLPDPDQGYCRLCSVLGEDISRGLFELRLLLIPQLQRHRLQLNHPSFSHHFIICSFSVEICCFIYEALSFARILKIPRYIRHTVLHRICIMYCTF